MGSMYEAMQRMNAGTDDPTGAEESVVDGAAALEAIATDPPTESIDASSPESAVQSEPSAADAAPAEPADSAAPESAGDADAAPSAFVAEPPKRIEIPSIQSPADTADPADDFVDDLDQPIAEAADDTSAPAADPSAEDSDDLADDVTAALTETADPAGTSETPVADDDMSATVGDILDNVDTAPDESDAPAPSDLTATVEAAPASDTLADPIADENPEAALEPFAAESADEPEADLGLGEPEATGQPIDTPVGAPLNVEPDDDLDFGDESPPKSSMFAPREVVAADEHSSAAPAADTAPIPPAAVKPRYHSTETVTWNAKDIAASVITFHDRYSPICEQYRSIRARLLAMNTKDEHKVVAITSSVPQEGKSVSSCNLGLVMAEGGEHQVVLIDGDFRRTSVGRMLGIKNAPGLVEVIRGEASLTDVLHPTPYPNLKVIPAGKVGDRGYSEVLGAPNIRGVMTELRSMFDYAIVDTPPVNTVSDVSMLAPHCDGAIMVIEMRRTPEPAVQQAVRTLQSNGVPVLGCILSRYRDRRSYYYDRYYYYYHR